MTEEGSLPERRLRALRLAVVAEVADVNRLLSHVLRGGVLTSAVLVLHALAWAAISGAALPSAPVPLGDLGREIADLTPAGLLTLGILVLILTPVARVALSVAYFAREKDPTYVLITVVVLANLLLGLTLGLA